MWLIDLFAVAPQADDAFLAAWESERVASAVLYRALRADVDFRFVAVARVDEGSAAPGLYEVVHEEGAPDGSDGVTLINPFEVPEGEDERFVAGWERARAALADQRGYLGTRLHRAVGDSRPALRQPRTLVEPADVRPRDAATRVPRGRRTPALRRSPRPLQRRPGGRTSVFPRPQWVGPTFDPRGRWRDARQCSGEAAPRARRSRDAGLRARAGPRAAPGAGGPLLAGRGRGSAHRHPRRRRPRRPGAGRRPAHQPLRGDAGRSCGASTTRRCATS